VVTEEWLPPKAATVNDTASSNLPPSTAREGVVLSRAQVGQDVEVVARGEQSVAQDQELSTIVHRAREREYQTYAALGVLAAVAGGSVAAGVFVASPIFWGVAGSVFFLASAGLVAWAAKQLGVLAATVDLFRVKFGGSQQEVAVQEASQSEYPPASLAGKP
jgi:hypothetical protein